ncbi:MAG TPA: host attachment protein [Gammaproteobacteria bacterium]|nr:host attachment protein [Gammaproteobacteria bacterium]
MTTTWVVAADATAAKIYALGKVKGELVLVKNFEHPEGRMKAGQITTDMRYDSHNRSASFEHMNAKDIELQHFIKTVADTLEAGRNTNEFERLILVASPHLYGMLREEMNPHLLKMVHKDIQKDYMDLPVTELYQHVIELE